MINAKIVVSEIDYEKSFANLFPVAIKKCSEIEKPNMAVRFLQKMGNTSMTAALGVMNRMTEKGKGDLLCALVNLYSGEIQTALKSYLAKNEFGQNVQFGDIFLVQDMSGRLALYGYDIKVNYSGLADNVQVQDKIKGIAGNLVGGISKSSWLKDAAADGAGLAAKAAAGLAPGKVEKIGVSMLEKPENKKKLMAWTTQILTEKGICITLEDCVFTQESDSETWSADGQEKNKKAFPEELEEELIDAVVRYLKALLDNHILPESGILSFRGDYYFLSNFYPCRIEYQGLWYQNAEAAFQAQKCVGEEDKLAFCDLPPAKAKRQGRQVLLRPDWESVKFKLMEEIVRAKFNQNPHLAKKLRATGDRPIIEGNKRGDTCWGVDMRTGKGDNHLGKILMKVRGELDNNSMSKQCIF